MFLITLVCCIICAFFLPIAILLFKTKTGRILTAIIACLIVLTFGIGEFRDEERIFTLEKSLATKDEILKNLTLKNEIRTGSIVYTNNKDYEMYVLVCKTVGVGRSSPIPGFSGIVLFVKMKNKDISDDYWHEGQYYFPFFVKDFIRKDTIINISEETEIVTKIRR